SITRTGAAVSVIGTLRDRFAGLWNADVDQRPGAVAARMRADVAAVRLHDAAADRQPESRSAFPVTLVHAIERVEDLLAFDFRYAGALIGHIDDDRPGRSPCRHADAAVSWRVAGRIVQQVHENLLHQFPVHVHELCPGWQIELEGKPPRVEPQAPGSRREEIAQVLPVAR